MYISVTKRIRKFIREIKSVFESNKVTFLLILSYTIWEAAMAAVPYEYYWDIIFLIETISRVLGCLIIPSLFIETCFAQSKGKYICGYIVAVMVSGVMALCGDLYIFTEAPAVEEYMPAKVVAFLSETVQQIIGPGGWLFKECAERFWGSVLLVLSASVVYKSLKRTKLPFIKYIIKVFCNVAKSVTVWFALFICSVYVDWAIQGHFLKSLYYEYDIQITGKILVLDTFWMGPVGILVMGFYLGPKMILALSDMGEKV